MLLTIIDKRGSKPLETTFSSLCCILEQDTFTPQKVLVIPRKRWLRPDMTEKLFAGTLSKNEKKITIIISNAHCRRHFAIENGVSNPGY